MKELLTLIPLPFTVALLTLTALSPRLLTRVAAAILAVHLGVTVWMWGPLVGGERTPRPWYGFTTDSTAALFVVLTTTVVVAALVHAVGFFDREQTSDHPPSKRSIREFYFFAALFLLSMYAVVTADNLGFLWISIEATTLLSAPLVYYHRSGTALEATWKYLIVCSVGIAFAFFGSALIFAASQRVPALGGGTLSISILSSQATVLSPGLLRIGFVFILLGYGTKAGLFPLHNWLPDAHSEAPAPASAMLSGALLNCALVALWRTSGLLVRAGEESFIHATLLPLGVATVVASSLFLLHQRDLKRLLAYSSMENVGLMAVAIALASGSGFALQAANHSLVKAALFLLAGNLIQQYGSKQIRDIRGELAPRPFQALAFLAGAMAVAGSPPFGSFLAEWQTLTAAFRGGQFVAASAILIALAIAFVALLNLAAGIVFGERAETNKGTGEQRSPVLIGIPAVMLAASLMLGVALLPGILSMAERLGR